jgi:pyruvate/2-oxoglutarate dehydrogenase complex dihydrolipoamide acyltransferase (E2) component
MMWARLGGRGLGIFGAGAPIACGAALVSVGDQVREGGELLEVETEKANVVIEAEVAGVVREIGVQVGERVEVGAVVGTIETP